MVRIAKLSSLKKLSYGGLMDRIISLQAEEDKIIDSIITTRKNTKKCKNLKSRLGKVRGEQRKTMLAIKKKAGWK